MADNSGFSGRVVRGVQPLVGVEKDEITELVSRIRLADERARNMAHAPGVGVAVPVVKADDLKWAEDWQLPREVFDYFILERQ